MKNRMTLAMIAVALLAPAWGRAADKEAVKERREQRQERREVRQQDRQERRADRVDVDKRVRDINALDNKPAALRAGMAEASKQTAVPLRTFEAQHKAHPGVGVTGLFVANELAARTHKPAAQFIKEREDGKTWVEIARAHGENLDTLESKLTQIETAMKNAK